MNALVATAMVSDSFADKPFSRAAKKPGIVMVLFLVFKLNAHGTGTKFLQITSARNPMTI